ncbi:nicotinamidase [Klebsiella pneumoniae]|uniref:Nicotinamidase n=6 Tax=Gammaproteobacteria TaxID=1236 RepID=A0A2X3EIE9_KLEPN|nr:nicotinamidase [Klebsiella pneumoniae]
MAHRALLLVDLQNDFCAGGALAVPEGDSTVDVANALIDWSLARGEPIVASQDWHPADHGSFASQHQVEPYTEGELDGLAQTFWPDHCVQHSEGAALHPLLKQQAIAAVFHKGQNRIIDSYSAFFDNGHRQKTELDGWLRGQGIVELTVLGLATDYCVKFTVLGCPGAGLRGQRHHRRLSRRKSAATGQQPGVYGDGRRGATLYTLDDWRKLRPDPSPPAPSRRVFFCRLAIVHKLNSLAVSTGYCC